MGQSLYALAPGESRAFPLGFSVTLWSTMGAHMALLPRKAY